MNVAVIGNSHIAAYKLGWEGIRGEYPGVSVLFFGATGNSMEHLQPVDGGLGAGSEELRNSLLWTSEGRDVIPDNLDAYVLVGMGFSFPGVMRILDTHRPPELFDPASDQQLISDACLHEAMHNRLHGSAAVRTIRRVLDMTRAPVVYVPNPYPTRAVLADPRFAYWWPERARARVFEFYESALDEVRKLCAVIVQPAGTIEDRMFTVGRFSTGSVRLKEGLKTAHPRNDFFHMNAEFGSSSLRGIFDARLLRK